MKGPRAVWRRVADLVHAFRLLARKAPLLVHPTPASLVRYRTGELSRERQREIQEHLLFCPSCPELLLDIALFSLPLAWPPGAADERGLAASWRRLSARLREPRPPASPSG